MNICALCGKEVSDDEHISRRAVCRHCGADLHICLNCKFYSETAHNKCLEPKAEFQRVRDRVNFCDYFVFRQGVRATSSGNEKEDARKKFEDLFRK